MSTRALQAMPASVWLRAGMRSAYKHSAYFHAHHLFSCRVEECAPNRAALVAAGAIPDIVALLHSRGSSHTALAVSATLLSRLVLASEDQASSESVQHELIAASGVAALQQCLRHTQEFVQAAAAGEFAR